ncbi:MAG: phosphoribosylamine--glycine ligase, partial [Blastocatellia bacterium]|nr:phosphoribosylamine--glycine ligase [Blastocatellia bacterium]
IVIEQFLTGREVSLLLFCDGESFAIMPPTRDHKRIGEGDTGPNTGGMGTFTDTGLLNNERLEVVKNTIIEPTLAGCRSEGFPISGVLFLGLMVEGDSINVLEYNVRFGDPEAQSILVRLESDLVDICQAIVERRLGDLEVAWRPGSSACVILAADGYPAAPRKGDEIRGLSALAGMKDVRVFHGGTRRNEDQQLVTSGGRVLGVTSVGGDLEEALSAAYIAASEISWDGMQFRRDIGR